MDELIPLVADVLELPEGEVDEDTGPATTAAWTSLRHLRILAAVERVYGVRVTAREARSCRSVGALRALVGKRTAA